MAAEGHAAGEQAGPYRQRVAGIAEDADQPEGQHQRGERQDAAQHGAEIRLGQSGDRDQRAHRIAHAPQATGASWRSGT